MKIKALLRQDPVLVIALLLAVVSMFFVSPDTEYAAYIDYRTLCILFCLMAVIEGIKQLGIFRWLAELLLAHAKTMRDLSLYMCSLCFFSSMVITNDVALLTFVPFTITTLQLSGNSRRLIPLITMETVAANLGSMLTPIGNPQNLYLFSAFSMEPAVFFRSIFPYAALSFLMILLSVLFLGQEPAETQTEPFKLSFTGKKTKMLCISYIIFLLLSLLTVFRILPCWIVLVLLLPFLLAADRHILRSIDYSLLFTFAFLFIFIGNLGRIPAVSSLLGQMVTGREVPIGILSSQFLSNVPAAILLSGFTQNAPQLLIGVNLGGLGTLIASMASLISFKFLMRQKVPAGKYLLFFTAVNLLFLICNLLLWFLLCLF